MDKRNMRYRLQGISPEDVTIKKINGGEMNGVHSWFLQEGAREIVILYKHAHSQGIDEGDVLVRYLPECRTESFRVRDPGYTREVGIGPTDMFPAHYAIQADRISSIDSKKDIQTIQGDKMKARDPIEENALQLLGIMVERQIRECSNADLQQLSGIEDGHDVNDAIEWLQERGAIAVNWLGGPVTSEISFGMISLKGKGKAMYRHITSGDKAVNEGKTLLIHGHDEANLLRLKNFLAHKLKLPEPTIMAEQTVPGASLPEKFERLAQNVTFAIAIMTPDDEGKAKGTSDVKDRCRQNVIIEIGWFWGRLGREHILLLVKDRVEMPSDLQGLEYHTFTENVEELSEKIRSFYKAHGVTID